VSWSLTTAMSASEAGVVSPTVSTDIAWDVIQLLIPPFVWQFPKPNVASVVLLVASQKGMGPGARAAWPSCSAPGATQRRGSLWLVVLAWARVLRLHGWEWVMCRTRNVCRCQE
jgi:hypothetical protein